MWSYSGDPLNSTLDELRFTIGDTDSASPLLSDKELEFALIQHDQNVVKAAIISCEAILAKWAKEVTYKTESETVNLSDRAKAVRGVLADLRLKDTKGTKCFPQVLGAPSIFEIGMNDYA